MTDEERNRERTICVDIVMTAMWIAFDRMVERNYLPPQSTVSVAQMREMFREGQEMLIRGPQEELVRAPEPRAKS